MAKSFDDYPLNYLYSYEIWLLTKSINDQCEKIFSAVNVPSSGYEVGHDPDIHSSINSIVSESARVKKLITIPKSKTKNETHKQYVIHVERSKYLQRMLEGISMQEILSVRVRNTLEHFDEYLDEAIILASEGALDAYVMIAHDMVISHRAAFEPNPFPMRVYISSEKVFLNMKYSINIGKLFEESKSIYERFTDLLGGEEHIGKLMLIRV